LTLERDDATAALLMDKWLGVDFRGSPYAGIVVRDDTSRPVGCVILNDYSQGNIEMTGAGVGCWTPRVIRTIARHIFRDLNCTRVTARTRASNKTAREALKSMGFRREGTARDWFGDEDAILYGLLRREQRIVR
jgi:RimJ/RimL family protein N-acetyltransferase